MGTSGKTKAVVAISIAAVLLLVVGVIAFEILSGPGSKSRQVKVDPEAVKAATPGEAPAIPAKPESQWLPQFKAVYALTPGQLLKRVPKPWIPQRIEYYRARMGASQVQAIPEGPDFYLLRYNGNDFKDITAWFGQPDVEGMLTSVLQIDQTMLVGPREVLTKQLGGDIVIKDPITMDEKVAGFVAMLRQDLKRDFTLEQKDVERDVIVVSGKFVYTHPTTATTQRAGRIVVYRGNKPRVGGWRARGPDSFVRMLQNITFTPVVVEGQLGGTTQPWEMDQSAYVRTGGSRTADVQQVDEILANVAAQTQLQFRRERRMVKTWVLSDAGTATTGPADFSPTPTGSQP